ncbi:hypothetical protein QMO56_19535 [Roseomonas sp. E05]|uniref:hypothetical protein n=1 Tax=Roseomonas sp. E05 TaxID=3046310 RepID=UPI0024B97B7B|nr:hypothetical protein [Roseomonas sp. E05]MDJ0390308.1 hypothetical protein [Roseomonas sp. E05]
MLRRTGSAYSLAMGMTLFRRLLLVLTALAFMLGTVPPDVALAVTSDAATSGMTMAGSSDQLCDPCPEKAPSSPVGTKMMSCGSAICGGAIVNAALPPVYESPSPVGLEYPPQATPRRAGMILPPDPFPPRITTLV